MGTCPRRATICTSRARPHLGKSEPGNVCLELHEPGNAGLPQVQQLVELRAVERGALAGALDLHDAPVARAHEVEVHLGMGVGGPRLGGAVKQRLDEGLLMVAFSWKAGRIIAPSPFAQAST